MRIFTVDAFTNKPFSGNPAGVCILESPIPDDLMQKIAVEINYSETAFFLRNKNTLRWFTPIEEVDLCGHATLSTAKVLYEYGYIDKKENISFHTKSGILTAQKKADKIELNFPAEKILPAECDNIIETFAQSLPESVGIHNHWCLIELGNEKQVRELNPDFELLKGHPQKIFIVTAISDDPAFDFVSRCFGPAVGINEDPVTGSAHCYLAPFWGDKLNKKIMTAYQVSKRTGIIECEISTNSRVLLRGNAVIMSEMKQGPMLRISIE